MTKPLFMSPEHVTLMNAKLASAPEVRQILEGLERPMSLAYELTDGPEGQTVYWGLTLGDTAEFGLTPLASADVVVRGDWKSMVQVSCGQQPDRPPVQSGDPDQQVELLGLITALRPFGVVEATFPEFASEASGDRG